MKTERDATVAPEVTLTPAVRVPRIRTGLTCARTRTVTTACLAGTTGTCACLGWTA